MPGLPGGPQRLAQLRGPGSQQRRGLRDVPPGSGGTNAEPGRQLGEGLPFAQLGQHQQGLLPEVEPAPRRADLPPLSVSAAGPVRTSLSLLF